MSASRRECSEAPFYVLGPLVTDIAPGYDHITSAIGGAGWVVRDSNALLRNAEKNIWAAKSEDVRNGLLPTKFGSCGGYCTAQTRARDRDDELSSARYNFDWNRQFELSLDQNEPESTTTKPPSRHL